MEILHSTNNEQSVAQALWDNFKTEKVKPEDESKIVFREEDESKFVFREENETVIYNKLDHKKIIKDLSVSIENICNSDIKEHRLQLLLCAFQAKELLKSLFK